MVDDGLSDELVSSNVGIFLRGLSVPSPVVRIKTRRVSRHGHGGPPSDVPLMFLGVCFRTS